MNNGWLPIESAPIGDDTNGPFFDVAWEGEDRRVIGCYRDGQAVKLKHGYPAMWTRFRPQPTHWMPSPVLP